MLKVLPMAKTATERNIQIIEQMFSFLTQPSFPKAALGLERDSLTALALKKEGRGRFGIRQAATISLPNNLLKPSFTEKNFSNSEEMLFFLDEVLVKSGLSGQKHWSVSLPSNTARTAILTMETEPASKAEFEEIFDWKAENVFGVSAGEMRLTRRKISPDSAGKSRYFTTAVKLAVIDEYETLFERKGWKAGLILPRALSEVNWLFNIGNAEDSLLISSQADGFTALILSRNEPAVIRNVTCAEHERDDEIYRLLMFYRDRIGSEESVNFLDKILLIGKDVSPEKLTEISEESLGKPLDILQPEEVGLFLPSADLSFEDLAAPAGLATLSWN